MATWYFENDILYVAADESIIANIDNAVEALYWACDYLNGFRYTDEDGNLLGRFNEEDALFPDAVNDAEAYAEVVGELLECSLTCGSDDLGLLTWYIDSEDSNTKVVWIDEDGITIMRAVVMTVGNDSDDYVAISKWGWSKLNGSHTINIETVRRAKLAIDRAIKNEETGERYGPRDFSFRVWNDLCEKAKVLLEALSKSWDSTYLGYEATLMSETDRELTVKRFNSLRCNIDEEVAPKAVGGADVQGGYIIALVTRLNDLIDYYTKG